MLKYQNAVTFLLNECWYLFLAGAGESQSLFPDLSFIPPEIECKLAGLQLKVVGNKRLSGLKIRSSNTLFQCSSAVSAPLIKIRPFILTSSGHHIVSRYWVDFNENIVLWNSLTLTRLNISTYFMVDWLISTLPVAPVVCLSLLHYQDFNTFPVLDKSSKTF